MKIHLTRRTKQWEPDQTTLTTWATIESLRNYKNIRDVAAHICYMVMDQLEKEAKEDGIKLLIVDAEVDISCRAYIVQPPRVSSEERDE